MIAISRHCFVAKSFDYSDYRQGRKVRFIGNDCENPWDGGTLIINSINTPYTRWWFPTLFIFIPIWGRFPIWLIFFRWVGTTNYYITRYLLRVYSLLKGSNRASIIPPPLWGPAGFFGGVHDIPRCSNGRVGCLKEMVGSVTCWPWLFAVFCWRMEMHYPTTKPTRLSQGRLKWLQLLGESHMKTRQNKSLDVYFMVRNGWVRYSNYGVFKIVFSGLLPKGQDIIFQAKSNAA